MLQSVLRVLWLRHSPTYHPSVRRAVLGPKSSLARPPLLTLPSLYIEAQEACPAIAIP